MTREFLRAEWRQIAMLSYTVDPAILTPLIPRGTVLDTYDGASFVTLVGFRFLNTRVMGVRIPFHHSFDEVNLRFYVTRELPGETRRGVVFIREIVPRRAIALIARAAYNEPYVALPMQSNVPQDGMAGPVKYAWKGSTAWNAVAIDTAGDAAVPPPNSLTAFIAEHYWGYTRQRDGGTVEYRVTHPQWRTRAGSLARVTGDLGQFYGEEFGRALRNPPASAFVAEGSEVVIHRPVRTA